MPPAAKSSGPRPLLWIIGAACVFSLLWLLFSGSLQAGFSGRAGAGGLQESHAAALARYKDADARILAWTPFSGRPDFEGFPIDFCPALEGKQCVVTHQRTLANVSGAILFSSTDIDPTDIPKERLLHQPWVLYSEVSPVEHPPPYHVLDPSVTRLFDYTMSYRLDSNFPIPAIAGRDLVAAVMAPIDDAVVAARFGQTNRAADILWVPNGVCYSDNGRRSLVEALIDAGLTLDTLAAEPGTAAAAAAAVGSGGSQGGTGDTAARSSSTSCTVPRSGGRTVSLAPLPATGAAKPAENSDPDAERWRAVLSQYKFVLVAEPTNCHDYVTRPLLRALQAQTVALADGPTNGYAEYVPTDATGLPTGILAPDHYTSVREWAAHVAALARDRAAYTRVLGGAREAARSTRAGGGENAWRSAWEAADRVAGRKGGWCGVCEAAVAAEARLAEERAFAADREAAVLARERAIDRGIAEVGVMRKYLGSLAASAPGAVDPADVVKKAMNAVGLAGVVSSDGAMDAADSGDNAAAAANPDADGADGSNISERQSAWYKVVRKLTGGSPFDSLLPLPRTTRPLHMPAKQAVLRPDYSCTLGKWAVPSRAAAPVAAPIAAPPVAGAEGGAVTDGASSAKAPLTSSAQYTRYRSLGLPADYLRVALFNATRDVAWPGPTRPRAHRMSRHADLLGVLARAKAAAGERARAAAEPVDNGVDQVADPSGSGTSDSGHGGDDQEDVGDDGVPLAVDPIPELAADDRFAPDDGYWVEALGLDLTRLTAMDGMLMGLAIVGAAVLVQGLVQFIVATRSGTTSSSSSVPLASLHGSGSTTISLDKFSDPLLMEGAAYIGASGARVADGVTRRGSSGIPSATTALPMPSYVAAESSTLRKAE